MPKMTITEATSSQSSEQQQQQQQPSTTASSTFPFFGTQSNNNNNKNDEDRRCGQCMTHLTSILTTMQSKPKILFEAMGVLQQQQQQQIQSLDSAIYDDKLNSSRERRQPTDGNVKEIQDQTSNVFWTMDDDGRGLRMLIPKDYSYQRTSSQIEQSQQQPQQLNQQSLVSNGFGGVSTTKSKKYDDIHENSNGLNHSDVDSNSNPNSDSMRGTILQRVKTKLTKTFTNNSTSTLTTPPTTSSQLATSSIKQDPNNHIKLEIQCRECGTTGPEGSARAYLKGPTPLTIILCTNRLSLSDSDEINEVLTHELIHVFDVHLRKWNLSHCPTLAKSEIRAAREAECQNVSKFGLFWKNNCVKEKARDATKNMFPYQGYDCVNQVFKEAMADMTPFTEEVMNGTKNGGGSNSSSNQERTTSSRDDSNRSTIATCRKNGLGSGNNVDDADDGGYFIERSFESSYSS